MPTGRPRRSTMSCADQPMNGESATACARNDDAGRSSASSSESQSRAASVANTLPAPLMTAGTLRACSAARTISAWRLVRTSTAR